MLWIANFNNYTQVLNAVFVEWNRFECCAQETAWRCHTDTLSVLQLFMNFFCFFVVYVLAMLFYQSDGTPEGRKLYGRVILSFMIWVAIAVVMTVTGVVLEVVFGSGGTAPYVYGYGLGVWAGIGPVFTWAPQIYATFRMKGPGSLSVLMLSIQMPGTFAVAIYQGLLEGVWIVAVGSLSSGTQQLTLLSLCLYYMCSRRIQQRIRRMTGKTMMDNMRLEFEDSDVLGYDAPFERMDAPDVPIVDAGDLLQLTGDTISASLPVVGGVDDVLLSPARTLGRMMFSGSYGGQPSPLTRRRSGEDMQHSLSSVHGSLTDDGEDVLVVGSVPRGRGGSFF